jgi:UPF0716 family protein affecting phage T7 exclusion
VDLLVGFVWAVLLLQYVAVVGLVLFVRRLIRKLRRLTAENEALIRRWG